MLFVAAPVWHIMHTICRVNEFSICETRHIFSACNWHSKVRLHSNATISCHASKQRTYGSGGMQGLPSEKMFAR